MAPKPTRPTMGASDLIATVVIGLLSVVLVGGMTYLTAPRSPITHEMTELTRARMWKP